MKPKRLLIDLSDITLNEDNTSEIQAMKVGKFRHSLYGTLNFTEQRLRRFADNVNNRIRGIDLDIDYDHKTDPAKGNKAAGWVRSAKVDNGDRLTLSVEWTEEGANAIRKKEYRYFSPSFVDEWEDPETGKKFKDVLFGGGITNRPFLKGMEPLTLSELEEVQDMDPKLKAALIKRYNLSEDATDEDVLAKVAEDETLATQPEPDPPADEDEKEEEDEAQLGEDDLTALKKLAETNPALEKVLKAQEASEKRLKALEAANLLSEINTKFMELGEGKFAFPPVVEKKAREVILAEPRLRDTIFELFELVVENGLVELGERGEITKRDLSEPSDIFNQIDAKVAEKMESNKSLSIGDATEMVFNENPDLARKYAKYFG